MLIQRYIQIAAVIHPVPKVIEFYILAGVPIAYLKLRDNLKILDATGFLLNSFPISHSKY
jgi:hypothetical protein